MVGDIFNVFKNHIFMLLLWFSNNLSKLLNYPFVCILFIIICFMQFLCLFIYFLFFYIMCLYCIVLFVFWWGFFSPGLEIGKFFFFKKEELINTLQSNKVKLFLSTDRDDVCEALHTGTKFNNSFLK